MDEGIAREESVAPLSRGHSTTHGRQCDIRLTMPARAENVAVARHVVTALAEALAFPRHVVEDIRLAVTEACTNVVRHAYRGHDGPLELHVIPEGERLEIVVRDEGLGMSPNPASDGPGLGLPLIAAIADAVEIEHEPKLGSKLRMSFTLAGATLQTA
jgi:anti-sigma regulatory factor (Ser/Thr protein kinase)